MMTEQEASTKRCQEGYAAPHTETSVNGLTVYRGVNCEVQLPPITCIGSGCMAWRWEKFSDPNRPEVPYPDDALLADVPMSGRLDNNLTRNNLQTVGDARKKGAAGLLRMEGFGRESLKEFNAIIGWNMPPRGYCGKAGKP